MRPFNVLFVKLVLPNVGEEVITSMGFGKVVECKNSDRSVKVRLYETDKVVEFPLEDISIVEKADE